MIQLEHITWTLPSGEPLIQDITLTIPDGKMVVFTGPNGGGKTTLAKLIAGIEKPSSGRIFLNGEDITQNSVTERAKKGLSYAFQQPIRFKGLTIQNMLELAAATSLTTEQLCTLLGKVGLCAEEYANREINTGLSGGEMKRIEIATVLARNTPFSIFDEPEAGIDLWSFSRLIETFTDLQQRNAATLMIISHQERILSIADEIVVIANGTVRKSGKREDVLPSLLQDERAGRCPLGKEETV